MTDPRWHRPEPTDVYFAYDTENVLVGLDLPGRDALARAVAAMAEVNPGIFRVTDPGSGRWRSFTQHELQRAPELLVTTSAETDRDAALATVHETALGGVNFQLLHGPDWLGVRAAHGALFDGVSIFTMMAGLLAPGTPPQPFRVVPGRLRSRMLTRHLTTHPAAVRAALAHRARLSALGSEPAPATPTELPACTHAHSDKGFPRRMRALRDELWPTASLASLLLAGFRAGLSQAGCTPHPGAEVLMDVRRFFPSRRPIFGNWAVGLHLQPQDDYSPESVTRATQAAARSGLPVAAMAAGRVLGRMQPSTALARPVTPPLGAPRISFTFMGGHSMVSRLPWRTDRPAFTLERTRPANAEAITLAVKEVGDGVSFSASHYASIWPAGTVRTALALLLDDPVGLIRSAAARPADLPRAS